MTGTRAILGVTLVGAAAATVAWWSVGPRAPRPAPPAPLDAAHWPDGLRAAVDAALARCRDHPGDATALRELGQLYHAHHENALASACYEQALAITADSRTAYLAGLLYVESGAADRAVRRLEQAVAAAPDYAPAHYHLGIALLDAGRIDEAITALERAVALDDDEPTLRAGLGRALRHAGRLDEARDLLEDTLRIDPDHHATRQLLGLVLQARGEHAAAQQHLAAVRRYHSEVLRDPWLAEVQALSTSLEARLARIRELLVGGRAEGARTLLEEAAAEHGQHAELQRLLGDARAQTGDAAGAEQAYRLAMRLAPDDVRAAAALATILFRSGRDDEAASLADGVLAREPDHVAMLTVRGVVAGRRGDDAVAVDLLTRALDRDDTQVAAHAALGAALVRLGRRAEAREAFERASALRPDWPYPRQQLERLNEGRDP